MNPQRRLRSRVEGARHAADVAGRPFEVWEGDGRTPQAFTCLGHPGQCLTLQELRTTPPNPAAWLYLMPHGTTPQHTTALSDVYPLALDGAPA